MRKRQKILKPFREYTATRMDDEGRFKGWSKRSADDMAECCKKLKEENAASVRFRIAYHEIYHSRTNKAKKDLGGDNIGS